MSEVQESSQVQEGIFSHSLTDYRSKVEEIIRTENERFRQLAEEQAKDIIDSAWQKAETIVQESKEKALSIITTSEKKAEEIVGDSRQQAESVGEEIEKQARQKSTDIINEARQKAEQMLGEAEDKARKEAKNRVKSQEEKIIAKAREEAASIINDAKRTADRESKEIIDKTREEAERRVEEETEKFRVEAREQSAQIRIDAEKKADKMIDSMVNGGKEVNEMIIDSIRNSEAILEKLRTELQEEIGDLTRNLMKARKNMEQTVTRFTEKTEEEIVPQKIHGNMGKSSALWVSLKGEKSSQRDENHYLFKGQIELKTLSTMDYRLVRNLRSFLSQVPNVKYLGESSSEEGSVLSFEIKEPLPLVDILNSIPIVDKLVPQGDSVRLVLS